MGCRLQRYECIKRRGGFCTAGLKVKGEELVEAIGEHSHSSDISLTKAQKCKAEIKRMSRETLASAQVVLQECSPMMSEGVASVLPSLDNIRREIRREKQSHNVHSLPQDKKNLVIPEEFKEIDGESFLLYDSGVEDVNRIIVFGTEWSINLLKDCKSWYMDGTFKICPEIFYLCLCSFRE